MSGSLPAYEGFLKFAEKMADVSGKILSEAAQTLPAVKIKADASYVTAIDKAIETKIREMISAEYPDHGIMGEEFENKKVDAELVWVIDPIDGTAQFIAGLPVYGTLIGLAWKGRPFLGVINHPATSDRWTGVTGVFAKRNGVPVTTAACPGPETAFVTCSNPDFMSESEHARFVRLREVAPYVQYGGSCFAYGLLASGRTNIAIDSSLEAYDYFASAAIINGAGGVLSNWQGEEVTLDWAGGVLASGDKACHQKTIDHIA